MPSKTRTSVSQKVPGNAPSSSRNDNNILLDLGESIPKTEQNVYSEFTNELHGLDLSSYEADFADLAKTRLSTDLDTSGTGEGDIGLMPHMRDVSYDFR